MSDRVTKQSLLSEINRIMELDSIDIGYSDLDFDPFPGQSPIPAPSSAAGAAAASPDTANKSAPTAGTDITVGTSTRIKMVNGQAKVQVVKGHTRAHKTPKAFSGDIKQKGG